MGNNIYNATLITTILVYQKKNDYNTLSRYIYIYYWHMCIQYS